MHLRLRRISFRRRHSFLFYIVFLGILWTISLVSCVEYRRVSRKLLSSPDPDLDGKFSNEDLRQLLTLLERKAQNEHTTTERSLPTEHKTIPPELMRIHSTATTTTTTVASPPSRVTTHRYYRRLRRKTTTTPATTTTTQSPLTTTSTTGRSFSLQEAESGRALPTGSAPGDLFQQLTLLNGILGALNSSASPTPALAPSIAPTASETNNANNNNANRDGTDKVPDILAILTGAKSMAGEASSNSETVVAPPPSPPSQQPSPSSIGQQVDDPAAALAILNLFGNNANTNANNNLNNQKESSEASNAAALLNLMTQSQPSMQPSTSSLSDSETTAALTKLLFQSASPSPSAGQPMQSNSLMQSQQPSQSNAEASANQLTNLLGLLGTLGAAAGQQQPQNNINNLFNLGGDQVAQAQTTNHLATLFGAQQQQQQQQNQAQNLLSLLGGAQGNQGFNLASLLGGQNGNQNAIPGLGLLSTVSSLGTSLLGSVSNIFGGGRDGKPRVRGKGVDTRVGLGYRLGNIGDAQIMWDIGPQLFTEPLRNEMRPFTKKRESGPPASPHYFQTSSATEAEKEVQQIEAKRRMVQAAIQDHYRGDHFASVYPKPSNRRMNSYDYRSQYYSNPEHQYSYTAPSKPKSNSKSSSSSSSSFFSLPFADHFKGFWSGITSGILGGDDKDSESSSASHYYNFDDIRSDFSANLIKRSSPDYTEYESRAYHPRRLDDDFIDDPTHSTLTEYERMLLQYGKDIGVANTKHGVIEDEQEPEESESNIFSRWFKNPLSSLSSSLSSSQSSARRTQPKDWDSVTSSSNEYPTRVPAQQHQKSVKKTFRQPSASSSFMSHFNLDKSFKQRNEAHSHPRRAPNPRPQKRKSHNPFRNFITSLKTSAGLGGGQRPRPQHQAQTGGFGRRYFKRPSSANPKLEHFTNTNKDLMMADANDDFVESAGRESVPTLKEGFEHPLAYTYANEFPDVSLTNSNTARRRLRPTSSSSSASTSEQNRKLQYRASLSQREKIIEPALLYDHLEVQEPSNTEADESFHSRNKVVVNPTLREIEKKKVLGTASPISSTLATKTVTSGLTTRQKIQRLRLKQQKASMNSTAGTAKKKIIVKIKSTNNKQTPSVSNGDTSESTTILPSVLSTISSIFKGTTKPKLLLSDLIQNASSLLPAISSIRILPRKKKKDDKTRLTMMNGKPTIVGPPDDEEEDDLDAEGTDTEPVVQVGHDMDFSELQKIFGAKNNTKRKRFRIRLKESVLRGDSDTKDKNDKERKDSDEDEDELKDIFVDIESGEVSVLKPVASLVSFAPKKEEKSEEDEVDYYEDDDGDGIADMDMKRKEHIYEAIQKELVKNFEKIKKAQVKAEQKKRRKQELAEKGMDESIDVVTKYFDIMQKDPERDQEKKPVFFKKSGSVAEKEK